MSCYNITFYGYTWDEYFYMIAEKQGILITYRGNLNSKGEVNLKEVLFVSGASRLKDNYECDTLHEIRSQLHSGERLFFSYAETGEDYRPVIDVLCRELKPRFNNNLGHKDAVTLCCNGACALFPESILKKQ